MIRQESDLAKFIWSVLQKYCYWFTLFSFILSSIGHFCLLNFFIIILVTIALFFPFLSSVITVALVFYQWFFYFFRVYQVNLYLKIKHFYFVFKYFSGICRTFL